MIPQRMSHRVLVCQVSALFCTSSLLSASMISASVASVQHAGAGRSCL